MKYSEKNIRHLLSKDDDMIYPNVLMKTFERINTSVFPCNDRINSITAMAANIIWNRYKCLWLDELFVQSLLCQSKIGLNSDCICYESSNNMQFHQQKRQNELVA